MRIVLVGRRKDKRVVRWPSVVYLTLALSLVVGGGSGLVYFALSGSFSSEAVLLGIFGSVIVVGTGLYRGLTTPIDSLTNLEQQA
ncbi:MAG TPA: hypothetical protein VMX94_07735 [Armatimonadota bacterium]|nr:hypothetical protein [Armatimonadota bacterium]